MAAQGKERAVMEVMWERGERAIQLWAGHRIQLWGRRCCHTTQLSIVPNVTQCPAAQSSWPQCGYQHNSLTCLRSLAQCANGNWNPLIRKLKSLDLHPSFDWLMSQTLGVGFAVRLLQSWFIIIIMNAILECKLWYYKAKVIHLWSVKCQMIFFLKTEMKFAGRHLAEGRGQNPMERQGAAGQQHGLLLVRRCVSQAQLCGGWCFHMGHSQSATALDSCLCGGPVWGCSDLAVCWLWYLWCGLLTTVLQVMVVSIASELSFGTNSSRNTVV